MTSKSEVTIRCFQPEDSVRCLTIYTEGMREVCITFMKAFYRDFLKVAAILLVVVTAIAVKWSVWTLLVFYFVAFVVMTVAAHISIHKYLMNNYIKRCFESDLLDIAKYYDGHDSCMFVAEGDNRVIGMVGVDTKEHHESGVAELQRMSVCSSARGKGVGTTLVNKVIEYCKEKKYDKIILDTSSPLYAAVGLYRKHGFKLVNSKRHAHYLLFNAYILSFEKNIN